MDRQYFAYIMSSHRRLLYIGVTNDLELRVRQHKGKEVPDSFTARYNVGLLVYYETFGDIRDPIAREKQLKGYGRSKKDELIRSMNPGWLDLSEEWG